MKIFSFPEFAQTSTECSQGRMRGGNREKGLFDGARFETHLDRSDESRRRKGKRGNRWSKHNGDHVRFNDFVLRERPLLLVSVRMTSESLRRVVGAQLLWRFTGGCVGSLPSVCCVSVRVWCLFGVCLVSVWCLFGVCPWASSEDVVWRSFFFVISGIIMKCDLVEPRRLIYALIIISQRREKPLLVCVNARLRILDDFTGIDSALFSPPWKFYEGASQLFFHWAAEVLAVSSLSSSRRFAISGRPSAFAQGGGPFHSGLFFSCFRLIFQCYICYIILSLLEIIVSVQKSFLEPHFSKPLKRAEASTREVRRNRSAVRFPSTRLYGHSESNFSSSGWKEAAGCALVLQGYCTYFRY